MAGGSTRRAYEGRDDKWRAGTRERRETRISDGRTRSATENEIGSINAARAAVGTASVANDGGAARRGAGSHDVKRARRPRRLLDAESPSARATETEYVSESFERERDRETTNPRLRHVE